MLKLINGDEFLTQLASKRVCTAAGDYGSGKTSVCCALAFFLMQAGLVDTCVSTAPLSFAVPASIAMERPRNIVAVLDELGTAFDARSFGDKNQNNIRRSFLAFPRKLNFYLLVPSWISPDASFRSMVFQRIFTFELIGLPLEIFSFGVEQGQLKEQGKFAIWDRAWLWRSTKMRSTPIYGNEYIPETFEHIVELFRRAVENSKGDKESNEVLPSAIGLFRRWHNIQSPDSPNRIFRSKDKGEKVSSAWAGDSRQGASGQVLDTTSGGYVVGSGGRFAG